MKKTKGLGKGLDSLFEDNTIELEEPQKADTTLRLSQIEPDKNQPRKTFEEDALEQLAASIKAHGLIQPIIVTPIGEDRYRIIAGERRWRACRIAGLEEIPVLIREYTPQEISEISLIENLQREDLNPIEEALGYRNLMEVYGMTQEKIADTVSKSRSAVANTLRLLALPEQILDFIKTAELSAGHARALLTVEDADTQLALANRIITEGLSVRQAEELVKKIKKEPKASVAADPAVVQALRELETRASARVGNKVTIRHKPGNKGRVEIQYHSVDELEKIIEILEGVSAR
ncbi:MAG: ParB/RepB/Spo0J family partition protein [Clostridia bacterium]|nr:ParB/RepB/Spo0J family partition protein [Clostridia bacterium]